MSEAIKPLKKMTAALRNTWRVREAWDGDGWEIYPDYKTTSGEPCEVARTTDSHKAPRWVAEMLADAGNAYNTTGLTPRQLVERVKELEEALRAIVDAAETPLAQGGEMWFAEAVAPPIDDARAALSKSLPNTVAEVK